MKIVCIVIGILWVCTYASAIANLFINGYNAGVMGHTDEWDNPKGEKINNILTTMIWVLTALIMVSAIILAVTH